MASPGWSGLSALPRLDTSRPMRNGSQYMSRDARPAPVAGQLPRKPSYFSGAPSSAVRQSDDASTPELFRTATEAVADVLGVDANDLPQPFYGVPWVNDENSEEDEPLPIREQRRAAGSISPTSFRQANAHANMLLEHRGRNNSIVSSLSAYSQPHYPPYLTPTDAPEPAAARAASPQNGFYSASTELYNDVPRPNNPLVEPSWKPMTRRDIPQGHDFSGSVCPWPKEHRSAQAFVDRESLVLPSSPTQPPSAHRRKPSLVSPLEPSPDSPDSNGKSPRHQGSVSSLPPAIPPKAPRRLLSDAEQVICSVSAVSRAVVVKPKAGLFEGQFVALLTLADGAPGGPDRTTSGDEEIKLQNAYYTRNLPSIRKQVEAQLAPEYMPGVWVVLERMPVDAECRVHRRRLQTWIQNANDDLYQRILTMQTKEELKQPSTTWERQLTRAVSKVLRVRPTDIGMNLSFANLGGNSDAAEELAVQFQSKGIPIEARDVMEAPTLSELAALAITEETQIEEEPVDSAVETFDLAPMQNLYFHTPMGKHTARRKTSEGDYRFNQSILLRLKKSVGVEELRAALEALVGHHAMLRTRFCFANGSWWQSTDPEVSPAYQFAHHLIGTDAELEAVVTAAQFAINIEQGPVFAAHHFHTNDGFQLLYLVAHHLVVDFKSWQVIANDLERLLADGHLASGDSLTFKEWTLHQKHRVQTTTEVLELAFELPARNWEYWGVKDTLNTYGSTVALGFTLESEVTSVLEAANKELKTDSCDLFMSALLLSFAQTFRDREAPILWNQEHERSTLDSGRDISCTVGWFTYLFPLVVDVAHTDDVFTISSRVKDARRAVAKTNLTHFTANLIDASSAESFAFSHCPLELMFTYAGSLGRVTSRNGVLEELDIPGKVIGSVTGDVGQSVGRTAIFEVSVLIENGEAKLRFLHNRDSKHPEKIQAWVRSYERILRQSIGRLKDHAPGLSMSDVPYLGVTPEGLNRLNREILPQLKQTVSNIEDIFPATTQQQYTIVHQSLLPGSSLAQVTFELTTVGDVVDTERICNAWYQVTGHHAAMRTVFSPSVLGDGLYDQIILRNCSPNMLFIENRGIESPMTAIGNVPLLHLREGVPWHRLIVCQSAGKAYLKLEVSQAICDMTSIAILFRDLEQAYFGGQIPSPTKFSFPEYFRSIKPAPSNLRYWKDKLSNIQPCYFPRLVSGHVSASEWETTCVDLQIPFQRLHDFERFYKVDKSTILRVAWGILLRTYVGRQDVCFGYRTSGRDMPVTGLENAVGPFSRVLACRARALAGQTIVQILRDAELERQRDLEDLQHQHVTMSAVEHELVTRGKRLFNTCISFGYENISSQGLPNSRFTLNSSTQSSEYDINVDFNTRDGNLMVELGHRILAYQQAVTVGNVLGKAVETILESASATIKEADLFTVYDHNQILAWNSMPQIDVQTMPVSTLIAAQAQRNADIQAVYGFDGALTYAELFKLSSGLAHYLLKLGVRPQMPIPVIVEKSRWAIVTMLAVLMVGAVLIPVDAGCTNMFPLVAQVANRGLVFASDSARGHFESVGCHAIPVNEQTITSPYVQAGELQMPVFTRPHDIACILLYASGLKSCRAVCYSHGALTTACAGQGPTLRINPSSRVMQLSSYSVDIALSEIFTTLVNGGCVCIPSSADVKYRFTEAAQRMRVNWTYLTPALSRRIEPDHLPDMAVVCFRSPQLDPDVYAQWVGKAKVLLVYGIPEACPLGLSAAEMTESNAIPSFGNPFCGNFWIVSPEDNGKLMPVGAVGELVIGGPTLAHVRSLDMENLDIFSVISKSTAEARVLLENPGNRLLRTGRLVRYKERGEIEFLVNDSEVKYAADGRPFRVADIESQLRQCIGRGAEVALDMMEFGDTKSRPVLAAFVGLGDEYDDEKEKLANLSLTTRQKLVAIKQKVDSALRENVPHPIAYIPVGYLPLSISLKVDKRRLQKLTLGFSREQLLLLAEMDGMHEPQFTDSKPLPVTQAEQQMRTIWARVLGIEDRSSISPTDGFITLGGDIITSHRLVAACRQRGFGISITDVLRNTSLSELCKGLDVLQSSMLSQAVPAHVGSTTSGNSAQSGSTAPKFGSDRSVIEDVAEASSLQTMFVESAMLQARGNVSYFVLSANGYLDWHKLENACFMLAKAHPILRTAFVSHSRQVYQTVLRTYRPEFLRYQCQNWRLNNLAVKLIRRDQPLPIDFRRPVTKFSFLDAGKSSILVMRLSRAQYDDLSIPILVRDLGRFYQHTGPVPQSTGFCEVIRAARATYASGATEYWRSLLDRATVTQIVSQPSLPVANSSPKTLQQKISVGSLEKYGIPFETVLKGAWAIVLSNLSGLDDVVFGQMVEGRHLSLANGQTISSVVGPKGNVIPVRAQIPDYPVAPLDYLRNLQSQYVASIPFENVQTADIIQNCTSWPSWTRFSSVVHHQRQSERYKLLNFTIGEAACTLDVMGLSHEDSDVFVQTMMAGTKHVDVSVTFCDRKIQTFFAEEVLRMLCSTIALLSTEFVMDPMTLKGLNDTYKSPRIPLPAPKRESSVLSPMMSVDPDHARAAHSVVAAAWDAVFGAQSLQVADIRSVPFYEIWGAHMPAAELARYYTQKVPRFPGLEQKVYTTEEIIDHPTMMQQYELIIAKQQETQLRHRKSFLKRNPSTWGKIRKLTANADPTHNSLSAPARAHPHKGLNHHGDSMDSLSTLGSTLDEPDFKEQNITPPTPIDGVQKRQ
ncbi:hypothetical protein F5Y17DRAFT_316563 [Xylariaceae sp. FL0594]|nr:hypothetical protein F5Y17DRAFT_316563 [Xylariaceae sp. FL0594]